MKGISIVNSLQEKGKIILLKDGDAKEAMKEEYRKAIHSTPNWSKNNSYLDPYGIFAQVADGSMTNVTELRLCDVC